MSATSASTQDATNGGAPAPADAKPAAAGNVATSTASKVAEPPTAAEGGGSKKLFIGAAVVFLLNFLFNEYANDSVRARLLYCTRLGILPLLL